MWPSLKKTRNDEKGSGVSVIWGKRPVWRLSGGWRRLRSSEETSTIPDQTPKHRSLPDTKALLRGSSTRFRQKRGFKIPIHFINLIAIFDYPDEIRKVIYTTNAIESLNSVIRKAIKNRKIFPNDDSALKLIYLAVSKASQKWTMPIRNWKPALNRFAIEYGDRFEF